MYFGSRSLPTKQPMLGELTRNKCPFILPFDRFINMLCDNCTNVLTHKANYIYFTGPLERGPLGPGPQLQCAHHCNLTSLEASAAQGCHVCIDLWSRLSDSELEVLRTEGEVPGVNYDSWLTYMELRPDHLRDESYVLGIHLSDHWNAQLSAAISRFNYVSSYHLLQPPSRMF